MLLRRSLLLLLAFSALVLPTGSQAHPFGSQFYSHQLTLEADPEGLHLALQTEIPSQQVMREFYIFLDGHQPSTEQDTAFTSQRLATLEKNLSVQVDGKAVGLRNITPASLKNGVGNANFFTYHLKLAAAHNWKTGEQHTVRIINSNETGKGAYFRHVVKAKDGVNVSKTSFDSARVDPGVEGADGWTQGREYRDLDASFWVPEAKAKPTRPGDSPDWFKTFSGLIWGLGTVGLLIKWRRRRKNRRR